MVPARWVVLSVLLGLFLTSAAEAQSERRTQQARVYGVQPGCRGDCALLYLWTGPFGRGVALALAECRSKGYRCTLAI